MARTSKIRFVLLSFYLTPHKNHIFARASYLNPSDILVIGVLPEYTVEKSEVFQMWGRRNQLKFVKWI